MYFGFSCSRTSALFPPLLCIVKVSRVSQRKDEVVSLIVSFGAFCAHLRVTGAGKVEGSIKDIPAIITHIN